MPSGQTPADIAKIKAGKLSVIDLDGDNSTPDFRRQSRAVSVVANSFSSAMRASSRVSIPFIPIPEDGRIDLRSSLKAGFPLRAGQGQMYTYGDACK